MAVTTNIMKVEVEAPDFLSNELGFKHRTACCYENNRTPIVMQKSYAFYLFEKDVLRPSGETGETHES